MVDEEFEIWSQLLDGADAHLVCAPIRLSDMGPVGTSLYRAHRPRVVWGTIDGEYLVAWDGSDDPPGEDESEIFLQRVGADGWPRGTDDERLSTMGPDGTPDFGAVMPDLAFNPQHDEALVVWAGVDDMPPLVVGEYEVRDNLQLKPSEYRLLLKGNPVGRGELVLGHYLALSPVEASREIEGIPTKDPAFGLPTIWVAEGKQQEAARAGYTIIDLSTVIATHLTQLFKRYADELLSRQTVQQLVDGLAELQPKLVEELVPSLLSLGSIQRVLQNLVRERVSIRDLQTICESLADHASITKDTDILTEYARQSLARTITKPYESADNKLSVLTLLQDLEERISKGIQRTEQGSFLTLEPGLLQRVNATKGWYERSGAR